ncbi:hypothetical protein DID80_03375, partial [Candidatus Marinamargulisbacteria bacterium SCGC AAA071-K20]
VGLGLGLGLGSAAADSNARCNVNLEQVKVTNGGRRQPIGPIGSSSSTKPSEGKWFSRARSVSNVNRLALGRLCSTGTAFNPDEVEPRSAKYFFNKTCQVFHTVIKGTTAGVGYLVGRGVVGCIGGLINIGLSAAAGVLETGARILQAVGAGVTYLGGKGLAILDAEIPKVKVRPLRGTLGLLAGALTGLGTMLTLNGWEKAASNAKAAYHFVRDPAPNIWDNTGTFVKDYCLGQTLSEEHPLHISWGDGSLEAFHSLYKGTNAVGKTLFNVGEDINLLDAWNFKVGAAIGTVITSGANMVVDSAVLAVGDFLGGCRHNPITALGGLFAGVKTGIQMNLRTRTGPQQWEDLKTVINSALSNNAESFEAAGDRLRPMLGLIE